MLSQNVFPPAEAQLDEHEGPFPPQHTQSQVEVPRVVAAVLQAIARQLPPEVTLPGQVPAALTGRMRDARKKRKKKEERLILLRFGWDGYGVFSSIPNVHSALKGARAFNKAQKN